MEEIITKTSLDKSIELISELNLDEEDYNKIFEKFKLIFEDSEISNKFEGLNEYTNGCNLKTVMKTISDNVSINDLNFLMKKIIKNESLVDFLQDLILEKFL